MQETLVQLPGSSWSGRSPGEGIEYPFQYSWACVSAGKESACNVDRPGFNPWVGKIPWRRERLPTPVFWPVEFHGPYSPWGHKESDMTEEFSLFTDRYTDQWNRTKGPEINLCVCMGQLIFNKGAKEYIWGKKGQSFHRWCWENWTSRYKRMKLDLSHSTYRDQLKVD